MHDLKTDTSVTAAYPKDDKGNVLHQILEETTYGVTLKGYAVKGGRFTLDKTLAQKMDVMNVAGTGLGDGVRLVFRNNVNIKRTDTFTYNSDEINLFSGVDWVFTTLQTPWSTRYIPGTVYQHVDINCDMIIPQQANNNKSKYVLHHTEVPDDDSLVIPHERMYMKLRSTSYSSAQIWIINKRYCTYTTLRENKSHVTLSKEAITNHVRGVDNAGKSIVVDDGSHCG